jgi:hypothetical protein
LNKLQLGGEIYKCRDQINSKTQTAYALKTEEKIVKLHTLTRSKVLPSVCSAKPGWGILKPNLLTMPNFSRGSHQLQFQKFIGGFITANCERYQNTEMFVCSWKIFHYGE